MLRFYYKNARFLALRTACCAFKAEVNLALAGAILKEDNWKKRKRAAFF
jgi:hypothetical protein